MAKIIHLVGKNGSGKSTHALILSKHFASQNLKCAGVDDPISEFIKNRDQAIKSWPDADVIFIEHHPDEIFDTAPGDTIISLQQIAR